MRYIRQFTRKQERNQTKTLEQQTHDLDLARKVLTAVTAFSFIGNPFAAMASTITRVDAPNENLMNGTNVGHIYAEQMNGDTAVNRFNKFDVSAGDIANMYFQTNGSKDWANNLVNFVNDRINVAGTVNAIKNSKIGGNLFFLSSSGMAVTNSGVINAGSLTVLTPTKDIMDLQNKLDGNWSASDFAQITDASQRMEIPLNQDGTITVAGTIHTLGDVQLYAGKHVNVSGMIQTKTGVSELPDTIFKNTVNIGDNNMASWDDLTATEVGNGDIVLSAKSAVTDGREGSAEASIDVSGKLYGNDVNISAESEASFADDGGNITVGEIDTSTVLDKLNFGTLNADYADVSSKASVTIAKDAVIDAKNDVTIEAKSNVAVEVGAAPTQNEDGAYGGFVPAAGVVVADVDNTAKVTMSGSTVEAGNNVDVKANAATELKVSAADAGEDEDSGGQKAGGQESASLVHAAVAVVSNTTEAAVEMNGGTITGKGDVNVNANVNNSLDVSAQVGAPGASAMATAVAVVQSKGSATVDVTNNAAITGANVTIAAENTVDGNVINVDNGIGVPEEDPAEEQPEQGGSSVTDELKDAASQILSGDSLTDVFMNGITGKIDEATGTEDNGSGGKQNAFVKKLGNMLDLGASVAVVEESNAANVSINNAVITAGEKNSEGVLENPGKVDIHANTVVDGTSMIVTGHANKQTNTAKKKGSSGSGAAANTGNIIADAAVLYNKIDNDAAVEINGAAISGSSVDINSSAQMRYNIRKMYDDLKDSVDALKDALGDAWDDTNDFFKQLDELVQKTGGAVTAVETEGKDDAVVEQLFNKTVTALQTIAENADAVTDNASAIVDDVKGAKEAFDSVKENLETFKDTNNYVNYYVHTESTDGIENSAAGGKAGGFELGIAGSVNVTNVNNTAATGIGAGTTIMTNDANIASNTQTETISITGNAVELMGSKKKKKPSGGAGSTTGNSSSANVGVGASVAVQDITGNSVVMVGEGVNISGLNNGAAKTITIASKNVMGQQGIVYGAGISGGKSGSGAGSGSGNIGVELQGMVNLMNGGSDSVVSIDDNVNLTGRTVNLTADNDSLITAVTGGATLGNENTAASVGASVGMVNYDVNNIVVVGDNGNGNSTESGEKSTKEKTADDKRKEGTELAKNLIKNAGITIAANPSGTTAEKGTITASELNVKANTSGLITNLAVEAAANTKSKNKKQNSALTNLTNLTGSNNAANGLIGENGQVNQHLDAGDASANTAVNTGNTTSGGAMGTGTASSGTTTLAAAGGSNTSTKNSVNVAGAGSVAINLLDGETGAFVDNVDIKMQEEGSVTVGANDSLFDGALAGAAAINWFTAKNSGGSNTPNIPANAAGGSSGNNTEVSVGGAAGVSKLDRNVSSVISNSTITNAGSIENTATKSGAELATGLGLAVAGSSDTSGTNVAVGAAVSYNEADSDIHALLINNMVKHEEGTEGKTNITNKATNKDLQIAGGISVGVAKGGKNGVGVGGTAVISDIDSNLQSGVIGGTYEDVGDMKVTATVATTQISAGVAGAAAVGNGSTSAAFGGAVNYSTIDNTNRAFIDKATITADGSVAVSAGDTNSETSDFASLVEDHGIDASGNTGTEWADKGYEDKENGVDFSNEDNTGSTIVNVATAVGISTGASSGSGAAAVNVSQVTNDMSADITGATITAGSVAGTADTNTNLVTVSAGIGASGGKFGGAGSVSWNELSNHNKVTISDSTITTGQLTETALNKADIVNVAGQLSGSASGVGIGASMAYNDMNNTTGVYLNGSTVTLTEGSGTVHLNAENKADIMAITAGATAANTVAVNAMVAVNRGSNSTEAVIGDDGKDVTINGVTSLDVSASDETEEMTIAGGITGAGTAAIGAGVAYSDVGGSSGDNDKAQQKTRAEINHASITTAGETVHVGVSVNDASKLTTIAAGGGIAVTAAVQGEAATALINKQVNAAMNDVDINADDADNTAADVDVTANSDSHILTSADVLTISGTAASVGAGVAVNRIVQDTNASVNGGTMHVGDMFVSANGTPSITNIGVGVGAGNAAVTGSVAVNMIQNDVTAHIGDGANITANNNVVVAATSDESIANYAGSATIGGAAAVGASVSINQIEGNTKAEITGDDTKVSAAGRGDSLGVKDTIEDKNNEILDNVVDKNTFDSTASLKDDRQESTYSGVAVSASSTHTLKSFLVNGGVAAHAAVNGTVNVNQIEGSTLAAITGADINKDLDQAGDVSVVSHDYTNSAGLVGTASIGAIGAGVGLGSDTNTISRGVEAAVSGKNDGSKSTVNADDFTVEADAKQGISSLTVSGAGAGIGGGVSNATSVTLLEGKTTASVKNANITASNADILATHTSKLNTMGAVLGAAGVGAGVGVGVSVLNENSETTADVTGATISLADDAGDVNVKAENSTKVNYQLYGIGGGIVGTAGAIGVSNVNSKVNTSIKDTTIGHLETYTEQDKNADGTLKVDENGNPVMIEKTKIEGAAENINISTANHIDFTNNSGSGAVGAAAVGVGVAVNTIDSQVNTSIEGSDLYAKNDINVIAQETRKVNQMAVNAEAGGVAGGANVMITNVGSAVADSYGSGLKTDANGKVEEGSNVKIDEIYAKANGIVEGNRIKSDYTNGVVEDTGIQKVTADNGGNQESIVKVDIADVSLHAGKTVSADATADTSVSMDAVQASVGTVLSANGTVGILDVHRNSVVQVNDTEITAEDLAVSTTQEGASELNIYQGTIGGQAGIGAAYGSATSTGVNVINIAGSTFTVDNDIAINAKDQSETDVNAIGVALSPGGAASVIVAEGTNDSETKVTIDGTNMNAGNDIDVNAERKADGDSLHVSATAGSGGLIFAGAGVSATANEFGTVGIAIDSHNTLAAGQQLNITALNAPSVYAEAKADSASMLISGAITAAKTNIGSEGNELETYVTVGEQNTFVAGSSNETTDEDDMNGIHITAEADATQTVVMEGLSISASLFPLSGAIQANVGGADVFSTVSVDVADNTTYKGSDDTTVDVDIAGNNNVSQTVTAQGFSASTFAASGTNAAESNVNLETTVNVKGSSSESNIHDLAVRGDSNADVTVTAKGDGGGLVGLSPDAASVDHTYTADTNVALSGLWNTEGGVEATAINGGEINLMSDALQAAVVEASGVWLHNKVDNTANVKLDNAEITTGGRQSYLAQNIADYDGDIKGSGYGGVSITGTELTDDFDFAANVEIKDSMLHGEGDEGSITAQALTTGDISSRNELKSAGVIPVSVAGSEHKFVYNNAVDVKGSELITDKKNQNVTLASSDNTTVDLNTTADTQGGVIGAASAEATISEFTRTNDVHIEGDSYIESANDVNLYAGVDANGKYASLNLNLIADAYNRTALPLATAPSVSNTNMSQNNTVTIEDDVASVRHINAKAVKGNTTIAKSAREYKNIGSGGSGSLTTTAGGHEEGSDESWNNKVVINGGTLTAGIHNQLDITISGETTTNVVYKDPDKGIVDEDKSGVDYSNISLDIGQEWFKQEDIRPTETIIVNNLKADYLKLADAIMDYPVESEEYKNLKAAMEALEQQMEELGFLSPDLNPNGNSTIVKEPMDTKTVLGIELPDIVVSGGNINIETDSVTGNSGAITAQGSPQINITNDSDLYLKVNDITIQSNGGQVTLNGTAMTADSTGNEFKGSVMPSNVEANDSSINITSTSKPKTEFVNNKLAQADIGVYGDITNAVGDINIKNTNYDITIADGAQLSAVNITLASEHGSVTRTSTSGIINVGGDPVSQYQFGQEVAEKIQKYVNDQLRKAHEKGEEWEGESFATRDEYITWLKKDVGVKDDELGDTGLNEKAGIVAGNNVYIKGVDVNINGLVQAGYGNYSAELGSDAVNAIRDLDNKYSGKNFTDSEVMGNDKFLVNTGGQQWNDVDKVWDYEVKIYYNPTTKKLLVDNVNPNGGQIYIEGNISSTGNGRLMAMDGMADINIDTTYIRNDDTVIIDSIVVNSIANKDIEGLITITDMNKTFTDSEGQKVQGLVTEYKNGQVREYGAGTSFADRELIAWKDNSDYDYEPEAGLQYQYTGGYKSGEVNHKSYTKDFLFWTGLKYDKTTTIEEAVEKDGGTPEVVTTSNPEGAPTGQGAFISKNENSTGGWSINGSYTEGKESDPSPVVTETHWGPPEWLGYIGGYGQIEYKWTTENATTSSSTSSINASNTIKIGFLGNGSNEGHINIKGNQNIELAGNISNAAINRGDGDVGAGHVSITSNEGSIISNSNAYINSDDVILKAGTGINVNHAAIGSSAAVDATTASGDIRFVSAGGDLHIKQAITGGSKEIDAETGNVYLEADGSILNASTGAYAVKGQRIDLISKAGSIGTAETALTVLGGSKLYSSDTMASSVNASAKGDVVLTQTSGDMRLGTIISEEGDAVLTVNDGSFVDAYSDSSSGYSDTADKIQQWIDMGLIKEEADDNNSTQAGDDARAERLKGLEMQKWALANGDEAAAKEYDQAIAEYKEAISEGGALHEARQNYLQAMQKEDGDSAAAYETYMAAVDAYFENTSFGDNEAAKNLISSYAEVDSSNNYGWSKNQLLYAIQESILNSEPGQVSTVDYANVTANNITLIAEQGGVGIDAADTKITADQLSNIDNLKVLAASKGGDLTWHEDGSVTVRQQQAINLKVNKADGTTTVKGKENVYLAGTEGTTLNVSDIQTENDIKLMTDNGVFMTGDDGILSGKNLTIYGGNGSVGTADRYITTAISGMLDANSLDSVYIRQQEGAGNLTIQSVAVGNDVFLNAADGIVMTTESGKTAGYINAGDEINLVSNGTIGKEGDGIRINNNGAVVHAEGADIYLSGKGAEDTLVLGKITSEGAVIVDSEGSVSIGRDAGTITLDKGQGSIAGEESEAEPETITVEAVTGQIDSEGNISITAEENIALRDGAINSVGETGHAELTATGTITQDENAGGIHVQDLTVKSDGMQALISQNNVVNSVSIDGRTGHTIAGDAAFVTNSPDGLNAVLHDITAEDGSVIITNLGGGVHVSGSVTTTKNEGFEGDTDILMTSQGTLISEDKLVSAGKVHMDAADGITVQEDLYANKDVVMNTNTGNILFDGKESGQTDEIHITSVSGNVHVSLDEGGTGHIKDTHRDDGGNKAILTAEVGNVVVENNGIGDVDLYEVLAENEARVSVADGDLHLVNVSGDLVAILVKTPGKTMDVQHVEAATEIQISGSNMDLDSIKQREDGDGFLVITPEGTAEDRPIDNLVIGDILTNGGVRFDHLWLNTGNIHVSEGALHLDKVYVQDKATFSTDDMTTNVFGSAPVYDDSVSSSYWVNTSINSPKDDLAAWNSDELNDKWMHIFFSPEGTVQISNGNLLHLADHNYAYNQRYSQVDWMNLFTDEDFYNFYDKYYAPDLSYHERYGLTSGDGHSVENAEEDELIVE